MGTEKPGQDNESSRPYTGHAMLSRQAQALLEHKLMPLADEVMFKASQEKQFLKLEAIKVAKAGLCVLA